MYDMRCLEGRCHLERRLLRPRKIDQVVLEAVDEDEAMATLEQLCPQLEPPFGSDQRRVGSNTRT